MCLASNASRVVVVFLSRYLDGDALVNLVRLPVGCTQVHSAGGCSIRGTGEALPGDRGAAVVRDHAQRTRHPRLSPAEQAAHH